MSTFTATPHQLVVGIDPGLATSAAVAIQTDLMFVSWKSLKLPAETPTRRRKLGITKGDNNERRLGRVFAEYAEFLSEIEFSGGLEIVSKRPIALVVIEGLSRGHMGRAPDAMSVMSQGLFRGLVMSLNMRYISLNAFELRRRLGVAGRASKEEVFKSVRPRVKNLGQLLATKAFDEHTKDACALAVAGVQYLKELP